MFRRFYQCTLMLSLVMAIGAGATAGSAELVKFQSHDLKIMLDVPLHLAKITDQGAMQTVAGWNLFQVNGTAGIESLVIDGKPAEFVDSKLADTSHLPTELKDALPERDWEGEPKLVFFRAGKVGTAEFSIEYSAEFHQEVANTRFSNENVGREVSGTILEQGAYLSPAAYYYPQGDESLMRFKLTADIPEEWQSVSDGNRLSAETSGGRNIQTWENPFESDGCMFFAAPFVTRSTWVDSIEVACYFFEADTGLFEDYLAATAAYIQMYSDLIGPYPYQRFTVVENFFPTGYGMPAWTLLGQQVLRLPFIIRTSLGHEVLHNWWGNSVYVDYDRGNWCEAMTVYGADYRYKLMRSPAAARDYRKDILKQYVSYVNEGNDFPIREFKSRTSPGTRTIGYNKAMMVCHMIEEEIGTEAFFDAWKLVYESFKGRQMSWDDWIDAFEESSQVSLSHIIPQWIDRAGAPIVEVEITGSSDNPDSQTRSMDFMLREKSGQGYRLKVPLRFTGMNNTLDTFVVLEEEESAYTFSVTSDMTTLEVDPDCHLFRKLYAEEVEPIVSAILGNPQKQFVTYVSDAGAGEYGQFAENLSRDSVLVQSPDVLNVDNKEFCPILLNPTDLPDYLVTQTTANDSIITVDGTEYPRDGHTFVLTGENWDGFDKYMVILTTDYESLPRLGQLVPHYCKYSYLVFEGPRNVGKGQWTVANSPLKKSLQK